MNGLSTLNRLLGKRNKDVSKSTSNLSRSTTNLDTSSQYNKIVPLAAMTNAPFEQTFRITVLLPRDQLYVARIGAKTRLAALMDMICTDKQLDAQKYLFRHPSDFHQGFELDLTIGEVGLNEIRLVSKKELENLQNNEYRLSTSDIFRLHQKNIRESSVSSSDLSRTSRVALKTTSPYSSTNSLNSMDSSGLSSSSRGGVNGHQHHPPVAPTRKKRVAPRPPSQNSIPEKAPLETPKVVDPIFKEPQLPPYSKKNFHVSSPNLFNRDLKPVDVTNNNNNNNDYNGTDDAETVEEMHNIINTKTSYSTLKNRPTSMYIIREPPENNHNGNGNTAELDLVNHSRTSSNSSEVKDPRDFQDPQRPVTPSRKRLDSNAKKAKPPAPAPPPRGVSLGTLKPQQLPVAEPKIVPTPSPRAPVRATAEAVRDNETVISASTDDSNYSGTADEVQRNRETVSKLNAVNSTHQPTTPPQQNVSKVMLNVDQSSGPSSLSPEVDRKPSPPTNGASSVSIKIVKEEEQLQQQPANVTNGHHETASSKPSTPIQVSKVHIVPPPAAEQDVSVDESEQSIDRRLSNGNSSDEDIKIYNIESGQEMRIPEKKDTTAAARSPSPEEEEQWTYTLPAPPKFADSSIKSGEYDEKQRYFDLQSTFVDNTTFVTERVTVHSDETERIQPIIREKVLLDESLGEIETEKCPSPTVTLNESEAGSSTGPGEVLINSDIEDGYRGGSELRESMLQTLEKRREKLKESELQELKESIEGVTPEPEVVPNESDIMKCAKLNEETVVDDYTKVVKRSHSSVAETKSDVISELAQVIREENGLKGVLNGRKGDEDDGEDVIPGVNQNNLSNFKIATYNGVHKESVVVAAATDPVEEKPISAPTSHKSDSDEDTNIIVRRKISADSIVRSKLPSSDEDESRTFQNGSKKETGGGPVKRRSLTVLNKSPKVVNRSDSFHSTRSDYIQSLASGVASNGLRLTPRSTSYISLIGAQRFENRFAAGSRRKSASELSICDAPSLQSLEVIKNILNTSRSNLAAAANPPGGEEVGGEEVVSMATIKRNSFTDISTLVQFKSEVVRSGLTRRESLVERKIEEVGKKVEEEEEAELKVEKVGKVEEMVSTKISEKIESLEAPVFDVSNESKSDDEKLQNKQLTATVVKQPQTTVVNITTTSTTVAHSGVTVNGGQNGAFNEKKWKYQGPPTVNLTTWSERPKIDVSIKSDRDYRFGGSSTLPRGYRNVNNTTKININAPTAATTTSEKDDGHDCPDSREQVPLNSGEAQSFSLPQEVNRLEPVSITSTDRLPIVRAVEYKKNIVPPPAVAQKPEKSYFYETFSRTPATSVPSGTATINRLSLTGYQKFQPTVRGFKSMDDQPRQRPVSMIESTNISTAILRSTPARVEKTAPEPTPTLLPFGQNTLRRTGLKDKILAQPTAVEPPKVTPPPPAIVPLKAVTTAAAPPPPPPAAPPKMTTPVVRAAIAKKPLPPVQADPRSALLDAIRSFNKDKLRKEAAE